MDAQSRSAPPQSSGAPLVDGSWVEHLGVMVHVPTSVAFPEEQIVDVICEGSTIEEVLHDFCVRRPRLRNYIWRENGRLWPGAYVNGEAVYGLRGLATPLQDGDDVWLLPPVAGLGQEPRHDGKVRTATPMTSSDRAELNRLWRRVDAVREELDVLSKAIAVLMRRTQKP